MFSFFKKKPLASVEAPAVSTPARTAPNASPAPIAEVSSVDQAAPATAARAAASTVAKALEVPAPAAPAPAPALLARWAAAALAPLRTAAPVDAPAPTASAIPEVLPELDVSEPVDAPDRTDWFGKLRNGLRKTGSSFAQVFVAAKIDDALYEELESALLQADAGGRATDHLLADLKGRVKRANATDPATVRVLLVDALTELMLPLEKPLQIGLHEPTVMMVVGVNGAGKTTSVGKLARHLAEAGQKVLLAAADTFRAAAREQLAEWAQRADDAGSSVGKDAAARSRVEIVSQAGGDPAGVAFDAVKAGKARGCDVVIADTAGRLTTQVHLMEELKKIRRVIAKAEAGAPHEVLLVIDGNTGQNALSQVQIFDDALELTGLVITKLDGTAKGGVLAAIALWSRDRAKPLPVYFIGVGEKLEDLQTFRAREFASALLG